MTAESLPMLLTPEELSALTDRARASDQIDWLKKAGWRFAVSAAGRPKVARTEADRHLIGAVSPARPRPNLEWFQHGQKA
jgi:hypothetical protein